MQTVRALLEETLAVIPDFVLDSPPPLETSPESLLADFGPLPLAPSFSSIDSFQGVELNPSHCLGAKLLVNEFA